MIDYENSMIINSCFTDKPANKVSETSSSNSKSMNTLINSVTS